MKGCESFSGVEARVKDESKRVEVSNQQGVATRRDRRKATGTIQTNFGLQAVQ